MKPHAFVLISGAALSLTACNISLPEETSNPRLDPVREVLKKAEAGELAGATNEMMSGTASLTGLFGVSNVDDDEELEAIADLSMNADFDNGTVTGNVTNPVIYNQETNKEVAKMAGTLDVDGTITGSTMTASANGVWTDDEDHTLDMDMSGSFYENEDKLVAYGDVSGTIDGNSKDGNFIATEN